MKNENREIQIITIRLFDINFPSNIYITIVNSFAPVLPETRKICSVVLQSLNKMVQLTPRLTVRS